MDLPSFGTLQIFRQGSTFHQNTGIRDELAFENVTLP